MFHTLNDIDDIIELLIPDTELILGQPGGDVAVCMRTYIRIYSQRNLRHYSTFGSKSLNSLEFGHRLCVETEDSRIERKGNLLVGFSNTGKNNL